MEKYIRLLDDFNKDNIIKIEDRNQFVYVYGANEGWIRTGIMIEYYNELDEKYQKYVEISQNEAIELINKQKILYDNLYQYIIKQEKKVYKEYLWNFVVNEEGFGDIKTNIIALIYSISDQNIVDEEIKNNITSEILNSINVLFQNINMINEQQLIELRRNTNTQQIILLKLKDEYSKKQINRAKYKICLDYFNGKIVFLNEKHKHILF